MRSSDIKDKKCFGCVELIMRKSNSCRSCWQKGKRLSVEHRLNLSEAHIGNFTGSNSHRWKGDDVGYHALHTWVKKNRGQPSFCEHCGTKSSKRYEWANVDGKYRRKLEGYIRLCVKCHLKYDGHTKIGDEDRIIIRKRIERGEKQDMLAKEYSVTQPTISNIFRKRGCYA